MPNSWKVETRGERDIVMMTSLHAPRELIYGAWTQPDILRRWYYGPDEWPLAECTADVRIGGATRFIWRHRDGRYLAMSGIYLEIMPPDRLVFVENWDMPWIGNEALVTVTLSERTGNTALVHAVRYPTHDARDTVLATEMTEGTARSYDRLAAWLAIRPPVRPSP